MGRALLVSNPTNVASGNEAPPGAQNATTATEANAQVSFRQAGTFSLLGFNNQGGNGANTVRLRVAGGDGNSVVTRTGTGWQSDGTGTDVIAANTLVNYAFTDTGTNPTYSPVKIVFQADADQLCYYVTASGGSVHDLASTTSFIPIGGVLTTDGTTTESLVEVKCRVPGTLRSFQVLCAANTRTNQSDFRTRVNGGFGNGLVSFAAGATGLVIDDVNTDSLADGDVYDASLTLGTGVEDLTVNVVAAAIINASSAKSDLVLQLGRFGQSRTASATANYFPLSGGVSISTVTTESTVTLQPGFAGTASKLRANVAANTYTGSSTIVFRKSASAGITLTITAGATGWIENASDTTTFTATDDLCYEIDEGTANTLALQAVAITIEDTSAVIAGLGPLLGGMRSHIVGAGAVLH